MMDADSTTPVFMNKACVTAYIGGQTVTLALDPFDEASSEHRLSTHLIPMPTNTDQSIQNSP